MAVGGKTQGTGNVLASDQQEQWWNARYGNVDGVAAYQAMYGDILGSAVSKEEVLHSLSLPGRYFSAPLARDSRVLDGFCGTGRHALQALTMGFTNWTAFDYSETMLGIAARTLSGFGRQVALHREDARGLSFPAGAFDAYQILGSSALGFFDDPGDDGRVLAEAHRVLRPAAFLMFDLVDHDYVAQQLADRITARAGRFGGTPRVVVMQRATRSQGEFLHTWHREYHIELKDFPVGDGEIGAALEEGLIVVRIGGKEVACIDPSCAGVPTAARWVYTNSQLLELLGEHGFEPVVVPQSFIYGSAGEYGTMGARNLYVGRRI
jgi:SAM-dependent methyltransferase